MFEVCLEFLNSFHLPSSVVTSSNKTMQQGSPLKAMVLLDDRGSTCENCNLLHEAQMSFKFCEPLSNSLASDQVCEEKCNKTIRNQT